MRKIQCLFVSMLTALSAEAQTLQKEYKPTSEGNPLSASVFCADPTAIDFDGRLYVYGSNDSQQYLKNSKTGGNGYGDIRSLVVLSTADMVNWTFHGTIDVAKLCSSWGRRFAASWAPSIVRRTTAEGQEEFFLYFANSGGSIGVLKGSSPVGPFTSPLTKPMIDGDTPGVSPCNWIFDPGAVVDENGEGWIAFGGGDPQPSGSALWPGNSRIAKLNADMTGLDGKAVNMPAPYLFEASELNIIGGRFIYTYNTSWSDRNLWDTFQGRNAQPAPSTCSMCYMVSDTPLDPDSWTYRGEYVPNEGNFDMGWGNNHTHLHKFKGKYYLLYHSTLLEQTMKAASAMDSEASGYRSIGVDEVRVTESTQTLGKMTLTRAGVAAIATLDPYQLQQAETMASCAGISYEDFSNVAPATAVSTLGNDASENLQVCMADGAWTYLKHVDFGAAGASQLRLRAKGEGTIEVRLTRKGAKPAATVTVSSSDMTDYTVDIDPAAFQGTKNFFFVVSSPSEVFFDAWQAVEAQPDAIRTIERPQPSDVPCYDLQGRKLSAPQQKGLYIVNGRKTVLP